MKRREKKGKGVLIVAAIGILACAGSATEMQAQPKKGEPGGEMVTHTYIVPPSIHGWLEKRAKELEQERAEARKNREGIQRGLERCGIDFPKGASVVYNHGSSTIVIRNTPDQLAVMEQLVKRLADDSSVTQVFVTVKEVRFNPEEFAPPNAGEKTSGALPPAPQGKDRINPEALLSGLFSAPQEKERKFKAANTRVWVSSEDDLAEEMSRPPKLPPAKSEGKILGVFTDPQFQVMIRALNQTKKVELLSAPSILLRSGQGGLIQVGLKRWGVVPVIGGDNMTVNLTLLLPAEGKALFQKTPGGFAPSSANVSIYDGHTVVYREQVSEDEVRLVFVTAKLVDPAGLEISRKQPDSPEKPKADSATAEVPAKTATKPKATAPSPPADKERKLTEEEKASVRAADEIALEGSRKLAAKQYEAAIKDYAVAVKKLPDHPLVEDRRKAYTAQLENSRRQLGKKNAKRLEEIVVPSVEFRDTRLTDALEFLQEISAELDPDPPGPDRGLRIVLAKEAKDLGKTQITLRLANVPLIEAIRYTAQLANCRYEIEGRTVTLSPKQQDEPAELDTNTYVVPPTFVNGAPGVDPFAEQGRRPLTPRKTAREVLEGYGVTFGPGTSATYNSQSSTLIVRQTQEQMELVEAVIDSLTPSPEKQIVLDFRIVESRAPLFPETQTENAKTKDERFDPAWGARVHGSSGNFLMPGHRLPASKVLTPPQFAALVKQFEDGARDGKVRRARPVAVRSGQRADIWIGDVAMEIDSVLGPDDLTIDFNLGLKTGGPASDIAAISRVTIWDGQTVVIEKKKGKKRYQTILLTGRIVDPTGEPIAKRADPPPSIDVPAGTDEQIERRIFINTQEVVIESLKDAPFSLLLPESQKWGSKVPSEKLPPGIVGILTDPQFQMFHRAVSQHGLQFEKGSPFLAEPGRPTIARIDGRPVGIVGDIDKDGFKIDLKLFLPGPGEAVFKETWAAKTPAASVSIWDGQTVIFSQPLDKDGKKIRLTFVTTKVVTPSFVDVELPKKDGSKLSALEPLSLFPKGNLSSPVPAPAFSDVFLEADEALIIHEVEKGDSLYQIAKKYGPSVSRIKELNRMRSDMISVGDRILIPVKVRDHFLERVKAEWELPAIAREGVGKGNSITLPAVEFRDTSLSDALEFFRSKSIELDRESPELERGFDFILEDPDSVGGMKITLKLSNVPLFEAVRYTAKLANCDYEIEGRTVTVSPKSQTGNATKKVENLPSPAAKTDPSDIWYSAFALLLEAEKAEKNGDVLKALKFYAEAKPLFDGLARQFPEFYPDLLRKRGELLAEALERLGASEK